MKKYSQKIIRETINTWQPLSSRELTEEDAREIIENYTGLFDLLRELKEKYNDEK